MKTQPKFMPRLLKITTEVNAITGIDEVAAEALAELLKAELKEYCLELDEYYIEEYNNALDSARIIAYDDGNYDGYADGYDSGSDSGYDSGYDIGYDVGYNAGYADGSSESH